jgi:hypothetical protein
VYSAPTPVESSGQILTNLREQMEPKEKARFDRQLEAEHQKLIAISRGHLELQVLLIGLPDPVLMRQYRKKKTHGLSDARGLTGAEIATLELKNCEALARKKDVTTPEDSKEEDGGLSLFSTPSRPIGESQGGIPITLAHRPSPEQPRYLPLRPGASHPEAPQAAPIFQLFPEDPSIPPASTAPPRLEEGGQGRRKRTHTERYEEAVAQGDLDESRHGKIGRA